MYAWPWRSPYAYWAGQRPRYGWGYQPDTYGYGEGSRSQTQYAYSANDAYDYRRGDETQSYGGQRWGPYGQGRGAYGRGGDGDDAPNDGGEEGYRSRPIRAVPKYRPVKGVPMRSKPTKGYLKPAAADRPDTPTKAPGSGKAAVCDRIERHVQQGKTVNWLLSKACGMKLPYAKTWGALQVGIETLQVDKLDTMDFSDPKSVPGIDTYARLSFDSNSVYRPETAKTLKAQQCMAAKEISAARGIPLDPGLKFECGFGAKPPPNSNKADVCDRIERHVQQGKTVNWLLSKACGIDAPKTWGKAVGAEQLLVDELDTMDFSDPNVVRGIDSPQTPARYMADYRANGRGYTGLAPGKMIKLKAAQCKAAKEISAARGIPLDPEVKSQCGSDKGRPLDGQTRPDTPTKAPGSGKAAVCDRIEKHVQQGKTVNWVLSKACGIDAPKTWGTSIGAFGLKVETLKNMDFADPTLVPGIDVPYKGSGGPARFVDEGARCKAAKEISAARGIPLDPELKSQCGSVRGGDQPRPRAGKCGNRGPYKPGARSWAGASNTGMYSEIDEEAQLVDAKCAHAGPGAAAFEDDPADFAEPLVPYTAGEADAAADEAAPTAEEADATAEEVVGIDADGAHEAALAHAALEAQLL